MDSVDVTLRLTFNVGATASVSGSIARAEGGGALAEPAPAAPRSLTPFPAHNFAAPPQTDRGWQDGIFRTPSSLRPSTVLAEQQAEGANMARVKYHANCATQQGGPCCEPAAAALPPSLLGLSWASPVLARVTPR